MTDVEEYKLSLYESVEVIKESVEAKVELVRNTLEDRKYIKISYHSDQREIFNKLKSIQSEHLPKIIELFWCEDTIVIEEYIEGRLLSDLIETKNISKNKSYILISGILDAVSELHRILIVHRDIKPSNIIVKDNGSAILIDFGIAKIFSPGLKKDTSLYGTVGYAPPEQYGFSQSDFKSDIYAIGITVREIAQVTNDKSLEILIKKCTEFDPNKRPDSIEKVRKLIDARRKWVKVFSLLIAAFCLCVVSCIFTVNFDRKSKSDTYYGIDNEKTGDATKKTVIDASDEPTNTYINTQSGDSARTEISDKYDDAVLLIIDDEISDYTRINVSETEISERVSLGPGMDDVIIKAKKEVNAVTISVGDDFTETLCYDILNSSHDYNDSDFYSEIILYDLNADSVYEIIPVIADALITKEADPYVLRNGTMAWCIGYDGSFYLANGVITAVSDPLSIYETTRDYVLGDFPKCYKLENKKIVEYEY